MAIDFSRPFGDKSGAPKSGAAATTQADQPKAQLWLNIGYASGIKDEHGVEKFVSLPLGIPLDTQEKVQTNSRNAEYNEFQHARNNLLEQLMAAAEGIEAGGSEFLNLQIQLRRVAEPVSDAAPATNRFTRSLELVTKAA